jgi:lipid-binding SYLF domain-containing protein
MKHNMKVRGALALALGALVAAASAWAAESKEQQLMSMAQSSIESFKKEDPGLEQQFQTSAGYAVFPKIGKGAFILGAGGGAGVLYEKGKPVGTLSLTHVSVGLQAGGQSYSELMFFKDEASLARFKKGDSALGASASAVAAEAGASSRAKYQDGVEVFVSSEKGLMHDLSVGGQTFKFEPFTNKAPGT